MQNKHKRKDPDSLAKRLTSHQRLGKLELENIEVDSLDWTFGTGLTVYPHLCLCQYLSI